MTDPERLRAAYVRPRDTLVDADGKDIGSVISTATPSPVDYRKNASITFGAGKDLQTIDVPSGTYVWVRRGVS